MARVFIPVVVALCIGCTSIKTTPYPNGSSHHFERVLVIVNTGDDELRAIAESSFVAAGKRVAVEFIPRDQVIPPDREYSDLEVMDLMEIQDVRAAITISDARTVTMTQYRLPFEVQGQRAEAVGAEPTGERFDVMTRVFDVVAGEIVWTAVTEVRRGGADDTVILRRLADDIVRQLQIDGVIRGHREP